METAIFFFSVFMISFSGAMAPGPVTAAIISQGPKNRFAGAWIAVGHGIIEVPLVFLIMFGFGKVIESEVLQIAIGLAGGIILTWMGVGLIRDIGRDATDVERIFNAGPVLTGLALGCGFSGILRDWLCEKP